MKLTDFAIHMGDGMWCAFRFKGPDNLHILVAIFVCIWKTADQGLPPRPSSQIVPSGGLGKTEGVTPKYVLVRDRGGPSRPLVQPGNAHDGPKHIDRHLGRRQFQLMKELTEEWMQGNLTPPSIMARIVMKI